MRRKLDAQIAIRLPKELLDDLKEAAASQPWAPEPQELIRRAIAALVECYKESGGIPMDMKLVQRITAYPIVHHKELMVAEDIVHQELPKVRKHRPGPAHDKGA
jgi:hypothetical protein